LPLRRNIDSLRNRSVGHYDLLAKKRSALTTVHPTKKEIRDYFAKLGSILRTCASRARFYHLPFHYNQFEEQICDIAKIFVLYVRGGKAP
jgi:hypothetical protein